MHDKTRNLCFKIRLDEITRTLGSYTVNHILINYYSSFYYSVIIQHYQKNN